MENIIYEPIIQSTQDIVIEYSASVDGRLLWLLGIISLMWLLEPKIKSIVDKKIDGDSSYVMFMYKWIGIGLIFMVGYSLYIGMV